MLRELLGLAIHEDNFGEKRFDLVPPRPDRTKVSALKDDANLARRNGCLTLSKRNESDDGSRQG